MKVGLLGASSFVGQHLIPLLLDKGFSVVGFSRKPPENSEGIEWRQVPMEPLSQEEIPLWISVAPIWVLPDYFRFFQAHKAQRVVALSSTSRFTKENSSDPQERRVAQRLREAEEHFTSWANKNKVSWIILRPTLIYDWGKDKNLTEVARFIEKFGFFPVFGKAEGLRQPIHASDVAAASLEALLKKERANKAYNI
ncbi:MAG: NAD(P)-dependent oxidoreductase, partial [Bdellovibrio sp.]